jgi:hypothetical protein
MRQILTSITRPNLSSHLTPERFLRQLALCERRALGQRRKAIEQITGYEISQRFVH